MTFDEGYEAGMEFVYDCYRNRIEEMIKKILDEVGLDADGINRNPKKDVSITQITIARILVEKLTEVSGSMRNE